MKFGHFVNLLLCFDEQQKYRINIATKIWIAATSNFRKNNTIAGIPAYVNEDWLFTIFFSAVNSNPKTSCNLVTNQPCHIERKPNFCQMRVLHYGSSGKRIE